MGATDNSTVGITINVVDANSGEVISRTTKNLESLGDAGMRNGRKLKQGFEEVGRAGEGVGPAVGKGMKEAGSHSLNALDNVRLLRDDLGIHIPRAMEKVISQSKLAMAAIGGLGIGLVALGGIEVVFRMGQQLYELYEKWLDVNKAVKDYTEKAAEAAQQKLFSDASFDTTLGYMRQAEQQMDVLQAKKKAWDKSSLLDNIFLPHSTAQRFTKDDDKHLATAMGVNDQESLRNLQQSHEMMLKNIDDHERLRKAQVASSGAASVERAAAHQRNEENLSFAKSMEQTQADIYNRAHQRDPKKFPGTYTPDKDAGRQEYDAAENSARIGAQATGTEAAFQQQKDLMQMRQQADAAGLQGERLLQAQRIAALSDLAAKYKYQTENNRQYAAEEAEVHRRFDREEQQRLEEQTSEVRRRSAEAAARGLTGLAAVDARTQISKADVDEDLKRGKFFGNRDQQQEHATGLKSAIDVGASGEAAKEQEAFNQRLHQLDADRADRYASESDRITQSAQKTVAEITKAWTEMYGQLAPLDARRVQSQQALNAEIVKINADAARQRGEAGQRVEDETRKLEDQARRQSLPKYQEETAAIVDDYSERIQKLEELRAKDAANADRYRRQELAEEQIKNGKLLEQRRALEEHLASSLKGLMGSHPLDFLKSWGQDQAAKFAAQALFKVAPGFSTGLAGGAGKGSGTGPGGLPNIFGSGWGGKHPAHADPGASQAGSGTHNDNPVSATTARPQITSSSSTLQAGTASITIGSATITGSFSVAGGGAAGSAAGASAAPAAAAQIAGDAGAGIPSASSGGDAGIGGSVSSEAGAAVSLGGSLSPRASADSDSGGSAVDAGASTAQSTAAAANDIGGAAGKGGLKSWAKKIPGFGKLNAAQIGTAASSGLGLFSAIEGKGGFGGALSGASSGAQLGAQLGGPIGAAFGAIGGAALGLLGLGARSQAQKYNTRTVKPRIAGDLTAFEAGQMDYQSAYDDLTNLITEAKVQTRQMGPAALSFYNSTIDPEIKQAQTRLTREQKAGRSEFGMSAAQFHQGGILRDFGSMATSPDEGWVHAQRNEFMLNQQAAMTHADAAMLMNSGASRSQMADYYGGGGGGTRTAEPSSPSEVHLHVSAMDARGVQQFLDDHKHKIRDALNSSFADNSGGGDYA